MMRRLLGPIVVFILLFLVSCSNGSKQTVNDKIPSQTSSKFTHNEQTFHIIPLYKEVLDYTRLVKENSSKNNKSEYFNKVVEPFQSKASRNDVNINNHYFPYFIPTSNVDKLAENTIELLQHQEQINEYIKESLIKSAKQISGVDKTVFIMPLNPENTFPVQKMEGVSGVTLSENAILLQIAPSFTEQALKYATAHEYHHTVYMENNRGMSYTLLDSFIFEGEAEVFARLVYSRQVAPWSQPLPDESFDRVLAALSENANSTSADLYYEFVNGNAAKDIPLWSSYKVGYEITQSYLEKNPDVSIEELVELESEEILRGSAYKNLLKDS